MDRITLPELLDQPGHDPQVLAENLRDMERASRWFGGRWLLARGLTHFGAAQNLQTPLRVLDVGCGGGGLARSLQSKRNVHVMSCDVSAAVMRAGSVIPPAICADGRTLPFADRSVDVAVCALMLHHLGETDGVAVLREARRVARHGVLVDDLVRSWPGYAGAWAFSHLTSRNPLTRHDGPLSVRRAYTGTELRQLVQHAGLCVVGCWKLGYRTLLAVQ